MVAGDDRSRGSGVRSEHTSTQSRRCGVGRRRLSGGRGRGDGRPGPSRNAPPPQHRRRRPGDRPRRRARRRRPSAPTRRPTTRRRRGPGLRSALRSPGRSCSRGSSSTAPTSPPCSCPRARRALPDRADQDEVTQHRTRIGRSHRPRSTRPSTTRPGTATRSSRWTPPATGPRPVTHLARNKGDTTPPDGCDRAHRRGRPGRRRHAGLDEPARRGARSWSCAARARRARSSPRTARGSGHAALRQAQVDSAAIRRPARTATGCSPSTRRATGR